MPRWPGYMDMMSDAALKFRRAGYVGSVVVGYYVYKLTESTMVMVGRLVFIFFFGVRDGLG